MRILVWGYEKIKKKPAPYYYHYSPFKIIGKPLRKWVVNTLAANCPFNCIRIFLYKIYKISDQILCRLSMVVCVIYSYYILIRFLIYGIRRR